MVGSELAVGAVAKGIEALITDTTKTGSGSAIGNLVKGLKDKGSQVIFQASRKYIDKYQKRHCQLRVLGMREPVDLSAVYTGVKLLDRRDVWQYEVEALEDRFRQNRLRGYSTRYERDRKYSGISIANQQQYLMVLGGPGAGKSTFLRKVGLEALRTFHYERAEYGHRLIPVLLELKRFDAKDIDIAKFIADEFEICGFPEAEKFAQNALMQGNLLVLLDGLDEVPSANLDHVLTTIRDFVDRYDDNRFIASCRVAASGYRDDAFRRFSDVTMADFDDEQIRQFIRNWFSSEQDRERDTAGKCWEILQKPENKASKELAHTPLLLTYLCLVYDSAQRFPNNRSRLYKKALRILLEEWAAEKRILRDEIYEGLSIEQEEILLSEIAYKGMDEDQLFFAKRELSVQIKDFLSSNLNAPKHLDSEAVLNAVEVQQGILVERAEDTYSFSHLTLQEYLTAQYIVDNNEENTFVEKHLTDRRRREIFLLLPGITTGRTGGDRLLISMEKQANCLLSAYKLRQLVQWANLSTANSNNKSQPAAKRAGAVFLSLARDLSFGVDLSLACDRALDLAFNLAYNLKLNLELDLIRELAFDLTLELDREQNCDCDHALDLVLSLTTELKHAEFFTYIDFYELENSLEALRQEKPDHSLDSGKREHFTERLYGLWFSTLGITTDMVTLSKEESEAFANYLYACELMIRCKEGAVRVSPDVWAGIESRILTVPATD